ncbi:LicD family protein [Sphingomonas sinipercae]|uniref:LicD family protein n=1 Tax=Sphingomonas sinipercae TaxID=2714944 RepID=A0A6G7ZNA3_9SPHN|nr:LicD family protein [Sphingomonas sinipercae]QIL02399.1 LicD family protein [Sphingomonas sinipercae]
MRGAEAELATSPAKVVATLPAPIEAAELKQLQSVQLQALQALVEFCAERSIRLCLLAGSALGARRHKGIIPWDDDIDVGMLRADFERFIAASADFPPNFYVQYWLEDRSLAQPLAKIRVNDTVLVEQGSAESGGHKGIAIDLFPLDNVPASRVALGRHRLWINIWRRILMHQRGYMVGQGSLIKRAADTLIAGVARLLSPDTVQRRLHARITSFQQVPTGVVAAAAGSYPATVESIPLSWIECAEPMRFHHLEVLCPSPVDAYLTQFYGDFMELPAPEKRVNKHAIVKLEFAS